MLELFFLRCILPKRIMDGNNKLSMLDFIKIVFRGSLSYRKVGITCHEQHKSIARGRLSQVL